MLANVDGPFNVERGEAGRVAVAIVGDEDEYSGAANAGHPPPQLMTFTVHWASLALPLSTASGWRPR